ncbi:hypothetical protein [Streptomyces cavernae]|uniref:hypothetical protein n=1 Tax=Streptomyces cavernae TaxID=2259034 RepID=UPI000FEBF6BE|nr:hypothetical protein [Streptomyces cavernae]
MTAVSEPGRERARRTPVQATLADQVNGTASLDAAATEAWRTYNDGTTKPLLKVALPYELARRSAAFHEAGHAVVAAAYGAHIKVTGVIDVPAEGVEWSLTGRTEFDGPPIPFWRFAAQCAAGERAQARYLKSARLWSAESEAACAHHDDFEYTAAWFENAGHVLTRDEDLPDDAPSGMSWTTACRMADLMLSMLWPQVEAVAAGIDARGLLTGDQAAELAGATNPPPYTGDTD